MLARQPQPAAETHDEFALLSIPEAARLIGIRRDTLAVAVRLNRIPSQKVGRVYAIYRRDALHYRARRMARLARHTNGRAIGAQAA